MAAGSTPDSDRRIGGQRLWTGRVCAAAPATSLDPINLEERTMSKLAFSIRRRIAAVAAALVLSALPLFLARSAAAESTKYPLTIENCGMAVTFQKPPQRVVSIGQSSTEVLLALGLAPKIVGTAVWFGPVLPAYAAENAKIKRLADNDPSFESVVAQQPDLVTAQYEWHVGPNGSVGRAVLGLVDPHLHLAGRLRGQEQLRRRRRRPPADVHDGAGL
jgi:hypothetical protein